MKSLPVAILAGGLATRMRPLTEKIPKSLLEVDGIPFIARQLELLAANHIEKAVLCLGHLGQMVEDFLKNNGSAGITVEFSYDGETLLGTAGSLRRALPLLGPKFFVLYGDSYLTCDFQAVARSFEDSGKAALMTVMRNEGKWDTSNAEFDGSSILRYNKKDRAPEMRYIDYGLSIFTKEALESSKESCLSDVFTALVEEGRVAAFEVTERFYEIGSPLGLEEFGKYIHRQQQKPGAVS